MIKPKAKIMFRVDASSQVGSGHLSRCIHLAKSLNENFEIIFVINHETYAVYNQQIDSFKTIKVKNNEDICFLDEFPKNENVIFILDSYIFSHNMYSFIKIKYPHIFLMAFDDYKEKFNLPINGLINISLSSEAYTPPKRIKDYSLWGIKYNPIKAPSINLSKKNENLKYSLAITMGGSDPELQSERILNLCEKILNHKLIKEVKFILGPSFENPGEFIALTHHRNSISVIHNPPNILDTFSQHDIFINAGGMTALELGLLNKPQLILSLAENQIPTVNELESRKLATHLGFFKDINDETLVSNILNSLDNITELKERAKNLSNLLNQNDKVQNINLFFKSIFSHILGQTQFSKDDVIKDYTSNTDKIEAPYQLAKWGSEEGMTNRFLLGKEIIPWSNVKTWLDIGSGTGDFLLEVEKDFSPSIFRGIDLSEDMLNFARNRDYKTEDIEFINSDILDFNNRNFDLITSIGVLHKCGHSCFSYFSQVHSILNNNGYHFFTTKNLGWNEFNKEGFSPYSGHEWFREEFLNEIIINCGFNILKSGGFLPRENKIVPTCDSHTIFYLLKKESI